MSAEDKARRAWLRVKLERFADAPKQILWAEVLEAERLGLGKARCRAGRWVWEWADAS